MAPIAISPPPTSSTSPPTKDASSSSSLNQYRGYDHIHWYVGNAKQAASYYVTRFGFQRVAYRGLETGSRVIASHVVRNGDVTFLLSSPLRGLGSCDQSHAGAGRDARFSEEEKEALREIHAHLERHGDGVKDVAFEVDNVDAVFGAAVRNGARVVGEPKVLRDRDGEVKVATIKTFGDTTHTLVERRAYTGVFLPGYRSDVGRVDPMSRFLPRVELEAVDHCVGNQDWEEMEGVCE
jgi:4-hydroxyphenylpyruvate dioxygenase